MYSLNTIKRTAKSKIALALEPIANSLDFMAFTFTDADWDKLGISVHFKDGPYLNGRAVSTNVTIMHSDSANADIRYEAIVRILGTSSKQFNHNVWGFMAVGRWLIKIHQAAIKVNRMKCFL